MAAIDDYVVTPGGVVDVGGNPVTYDASGNINPTYTTDMSSSLSGLTSLLTPFKGIFDRLKSGQTTANDVNAALGVLGLLMPSLNAPKTAGWKGSVDLNRQFTRTPTAPIEYTPYSGKPVMGRQYFTSTYGAAGAPPAAPPAQPPAQPPAEQASTGNKATAQGANTSAPPPPPPPTYTYPTTLVAGSPGSTYQPFEGWSEYFDPTGAYRRFTSTGTPIDPMRYGSGSGSIAGQAISPYSVSSAALGFTPDKAGYDARLAADKATAAKARGGIASLRKFDEGGSVASQTKQPKVVLFGDSISSAVGYGKDTNKDTKYGDNVASILSKQLGVPVDLQAVGGATTKDALNSDYLPGGSYAKYLEEQRPDVVLLRFGAADAIRLNDPQQTLSNIQNMVDLAKSYGATPVLIGVSPFAPGNDVRAGNIVDWSIDPYLDSANQINAGLQQIAGQNQLSFVDMRNMDVPQGALLDGVHPTADFGKAMAEQIGQVVGSSLPQFQNTFTPIQPQQATQAPQVVEQPVTEVLQTAFSQPQQQIQQPAALTGLAGSLPSGWSGYGAEQKIDWFNQNRVTPEQLLGAGAGVTQSDIDWMKGHGYLGSYEPETSMAQMPSMAQPQAVISTPQQPAMVQAAQPTGIAQLAQQSIPNEQPQIPRLGQEEQVEAAQGGLMGFARGGAPRYLRGHTDGMADKIPSDIDGVQPAKLSHGEFVIPADVVSHLGNGNSDAGADVLYKMMDRVRQARTGTKKQGREINPEKFTPGGIAGYAGGGAVAFAAGDLVSDPTKTPLGTSTETNISSWAGPYVGDMLSKTSALTNAPYQAWTGPLSAGYSPLQEKVFSGLGSMQFPGVLGQSFTGSGTPTLPSATDMTGGPATGIAANYMNPYLNAVLQPQLEELRRQSQITQMGTAGKLAQAGAFGGSRQAIMDAEAQRNLLQEQNKAIGTGYASAYDKALQQFNTEQGQAKTLAEMMAGAGQQQRGIEQEGITEARKQFETEQLKPYTDLRFQKEMLSGLPVQTAATTANTSTMGQFAGGFEQLAKALKELGVG